MGRRLVLTRDHLIAMLKKDEFYEALPEFAYLQPTVKESWSMYMDERNCQRCFQEWHYMKGVCDAAFLKMKECQAENPEILQRLKGWLTKRKGYEISVVVLYYRASMKGKIATFKF